MENNENLEPDNNQPVDPTPEEVKDGNAVDPSPVPDTPAPREITLPLKKSGWESLRTDDPSGTIDVNVPSVQLEETKKKPPKKRSRFSMLGSIQSLILIAAIAATMLTLWTPSSLFTNNMIREMLSDIESEKAPPVTVPTATEPPKPRIGIVAGHWGNDSGSVCPNGTTEADVNLRIANLTREYLMSDGYEVDVLKEFDPKLKLYSAASLVSIHNDSCTFVDQQATGIKVAAALSDAYPEKSAKLTACLIDRYSSVTGLKFHANTITDDMTEYHAFNEINSNTTAAIIETGFLNMDYEILTEQTDKVARGVADGILCFIRNESIAIPIESSTATPTLPSP